MLAGRFRYGHAVGADLSGQLGGLGLRGEAAMTRPFSSSAYGRVLLGVDYGFRNTLTLTAELYFNGQGVSDPAGYDFAAVLQGSTLNVARHYGAVAVSYQVTPLAKLTLYSVVNADDWSGGGVAAVRVFGGRKPGPRRRAPGLLRGIGNRVRAVQQAPAWRSAMLLLRETGKAGSGKRSSAALHRVQRPHPDHRGRTGCLGQGRGHQAVRSALESPRDPGRRPGETVRPPH